MDLRKYRWSKAYESAEEELLNFLDSKHITAERHDATADEEFPAHMHASDKKLWCAEGSIVLIINGQRMSLQPGDALDLPAYAVHEAAAGFSGCVFYQFPTAAANPAIPTK